MSHFVYELIPPRPTFDSDMTEAEAATMGEHAGYWSELLANRVAVVFGPVADPAGTWGLAVVEADAEADVHALGKRDPAITSGIATFEVCAMPMAIVRS